MNDKAKKYIDSLDGIDKIEFDKVNKTMVCDTSDGAMTCTFYFYEVENIYDIDKKEYVLSLVQVVDHELKKMEIYPFSKISDELEDLFHSFNDLIESNNKKVTVYYDEDKTIH